MKLKTTSTILIVLILFTTACGGTRLPIYNDNQVYTQPIVIDPTRTYEIFIKNRKDALRLKGDRFALTSNGLVIRDSKSQEVTKTFSHEDVTSISRINYNTRGKNTLIGMGIGAGTGFALGWIPVGAMSLRNCSNSGDPGDCRILRTAGWVMLPIFTVVGAGIGAGIGALMKAEKK